MNKEIKKIIDRNPDHDKRLLFFTGKGGVGKTSVSSATAVWLAENDHKTLLVTTDPADHLSQMFDIEVTSEAVTVEGEENLDIA
ncbi:MAG: ArsA family ATPase, partial [Halarsenatibacteraceae bacterium]